MRKVLGVITPLGWAAVALAAAMAICALSWGWAELAAGAGALVAALVVAGVLTAGRSAYQVSLDMAESRVRVGMRATGRVEFRNTSRRRSLPARVELPVGSGSAGFALPSLAPGATHDELFRIPTNRRAVIVVGPLRSTRGDPFGLIRRQVTWTQPRELYVHPELVPLAGLSAGVLRDLEGQSTRVLSEHDMSFHGLRGYVPGDDRRNIHWKTTARTGTLMVRQFEDTRRTHTALALSLDSADYADDAEFELAVSVLASIGAQCLRQSRPLSVLVGASEFPRLPGPRFLDQCSGIQASGAAFGAGDGVGVAGIGGRLSEAAGDASLAMLIAGSGRGLDGLYEEAVHIPAGVRTVLLTCQLGAEATIRTRARTTRAIVGALPDLPRVLREAVGE